MKKVIKEIHGTGTFHLIDHSISHNQFLYRGQSGSGQNKDILITGVEYLSIPVYLSNFKIYKGNGEDSELVFKEYSARGCNNVFVVVENEHKHYLVAERILTQENDYHGSETSIPIKREKPLTESDLVDLADKLKSDFDDKGLQFVIDKYLQKGDWEILE